MSLRNYVGTLVDKLSISFHFLTTIRVLDYVAIIFPFPSISLFLFFSYFVSSITHPHVSDANGHPPVPSLAAEGDFQVAGANGASDALVTDISIERGVPSGLAADCKTCNADISDARRFDTMFSDGTNPFMFNH